MSVGRGARLALGRWHRRWGAVAAITVVVSVVALALAEHRATSVGAADRALLGATFGLVVPLFAYAVVGRAFAGRRLGEGVESIARHGASRRSLALGGIFASSVTVAVSSGVLAALTVVVARSSGDADRVSDALTSGWIGVLGGAAYVGLFAAGSLLGVVGRLGCLLLDWVLGASGTFAAVPWPRAHVRNLLGAEPPLDMPQWAAAVALAALGLGYAGFALWRTPR